jgi:hypothetical protein
MQRQQPESQPLGRQQLGLAQLQLALGFQQLVSQQQLPQRQLLPVPERQQVLEFQPAQLPELLGQRKYLRLHQ